MTIISDSDGASEKGEECPVAQVSEGEDGKSGRCAGGGSLGQEPAGKSKKAFGQ
jgi:hypothetical protein